MKKVACLILVLVLALGMFTGCSLIENNEKLQDIGGNVGDAAEESVADGDASSSKLEKLKIAELPLENIFNEKDIHDGYVFLNSSGIGNTKIEEYHGALLKLKNNNGVFVWTEFNSIPSITWGDGDTFVRCYCRSDGLKAPTNPVFTEIDGGETDNFTYTIFRYDGIVDPDYNEYNVFVDYGCTKNTITFGIDFEWKKWTELNGNSMFDEKAKQVFDELMPMLDICCSCCDK